jgi:hypothetical protein
MDATANAEPPVRITIDRIKNPKRQEHMKKVNEKKKELKLKIEQEQEVDSSNKPTLSWSFLQGSSIFVAVLSLLYLGRKYLLKSPIPIKQVAIIQSNEKTKESKFPDF